MSEEMQSTLNDTISLNQKTVEVLVANIIPTTKYFESRFDHLQYQVDELKNGQNKILDLMNVGFSEIRTDIDKRFEQVDNRFVDMKTGIDNRFVDMKTDIDKRFEQVDQRFVDMKTDMDKRFEQVDKRFVDMKNDMDKRFEQVDQRFEQVDQRFVDMKTDMDKRFEQVDKRFEQVDKRFQSIEDKLDKIMERIDRKIDEGLRENRAMSIRLFTFAMMFTAVSVAGLMGKMFHLF